jgi:hypothetical protein
MTSRTKIGFYLMVPGLLVLDWAVFRYLLGTDYVAWYLANGALIAVGTAFVSRIWESVESLGRSLISADPLAYYGRCLGIAGIAMYVVANALLSPAPEVRSVETRQYRLDAALAPLDYLLNVVIMIVVAGLVVGWLLFVAPMNYLVTLVSGAPARMYHRYPDKRIIGIMGRTLPDRDEETLYIGRSSLHLYDVGTRDSPRLTPEEETILAEESETNEENVVDLTFGRDPFATTQALTGLVVFVLARFV